MLVSSSLGRCRDGLVAAILLSAAVEEAITAAGVKRRIEEMKFRSARSW